MQVSWQRVRVANALAATGEEWAALLDTHNSGMPPCWLACCDTSPSVACVLQHQQFMLQAA